MALSWRPFIISRLNDVSLHSLHPLKPPPPPSLLLRRRRCLITACLVSGVDGFSDDAVSTRKSTFDRGFTVIANMLKRIEPLDNSVISKGVSDSARDFMKQTISTMLGLLPSDQFSVTVTVSKHPLQAPVTVTMLGLLPSDCYSIENFLVSLLGLCKVEIFMNRDTNG